MHTTAPPPNHQRARPAASSDRADPATTEHSIGAETDDHDLSDMLQELRILLQGAQVLSAFLIILPFSEGFGRLDQFEKWVYLVTFTSSIVGLIFISAPAAQHRLQRPLRNRTRFKHFASTMILIGVGAISVALTLATQLVTNEVVGFVPSIVVSVVTGVLIGVFWWLLPVATRRHA